MSASLAILDEAFASASDALVEVEALRQDKIKLRQSILKAAFEGRLVPQDPADEPASVLLVRLRAETATGPAGRRPRGRSRETAQGTLAL